MRFDPDHESPDLVDQRGQGAPRLAGAGLLGFLPLLLRFRFGWVIILLVVGYGYISNFTGSKTQGVRDNSATAAPERGDPSHFVGFVLDDAQDAWRQIFAKGGRTYRKAKLILFTGATNTGCGYGDAATGPFYCPRDERVYIDLGFYDELAQRFGVKGDFAEAYVIAHEIGHHVQKQLGISDQVEHASRASLNGPTGLSVRMELQADCFAGIWARSTNQRQLLDPGDVQEALGAAAAVGDDHIQRETTGTVRPESWTHGSAEARSRWFQNGFDGGTLEACDTFGAAKL